jgi:hypothetical protein
MPNDKEKKLREMYKELAALARESIERDKQLAKLETEVIAMRDAVPQWVSVKDRLPDASNVYLVTRAERSGEQYREVSGFYLLHMTFDKSDDGANVTHWMSLPELPTGGSDTECCQRSKA